VDEAPEAGAVPAGAARGDALADLGDVVGLDAGHVDAISGAADEAPSSLVGVGGLQVLEAVQKPAVARIEPGDGTVIAVVLVGVAVGEAVIELKSCV
jgi:hypothetical protein